MFEQQLRLFDDGEPFLERRRVRVDGRQEVEHGDDWLGKRLAELRHLLLQEAPRFSGKARPVEGRTAAPPRTSLHDRAYYSGRLVIGYGFGMKTRFNEDWLAVVLGLFFFGLSLGPL